MPDTDTLTPEAGPQPPEKTRMSRGIRDEKEKKNAKGENRDPGQRKRLGHDKQGQSKTRQAINAVRDPLKAAREKAQKLNPLNSMKNLREKLSPKQALKGGGKKLLKAGAQRAVVALATVSWPVWAVIGGILLIIVVFVTVMGPGGTDPNALTKLTLTMTGPTEAVTGAELDYQINVGYPGTAQDILITDNIPLGTEFISSGQKATCDNGICNNASKTITWSLRENVILQNSLLSNVSSILSLKLKATANNSFLINQAEGTVMGEGLPPGDGGGPPAEGYIPPQPETNNCGGKYDFSKWPELNSVGNFGDPQCNFSKESLGNLINVKEPNPEYANIWFNIIVPGEAVNYSPNTHAPPSSGTPDAGGAWGLYQMGSSKPPPPGQPPPAPGNNGIYDRGDVNWELQTTNAIAYWKLIHCNFWSYWEAYRKAGLRDVDHC